MKYDLIVIGAGPGGYQAAIHGAECGLKVAIVEQSPFLGGTCLNVGCIPSKALLHYTELYSHCKNAPFLGCQLDYQALQLHTKKTIELIRSGLQELFLAHKVEIIHGHASLQSPTTIAINERKLQANQILLATGSEPIQLPFLPFDEKRVLSSAEALFLEKVPASMVVIGGGVIGCEMASVFSRLGTKVTIVELLPTLCSGIDSDLQKGLERALPEQGIELLLSQEVTGGKVGDNGVEIQLKERTLSAEVVLVACGRRPNSHDLGLEHIGISLLPSHHIEVDRNCQTTAPSVYAIGDLIEGAQLAHRAEIEGKFVAASIAGKNPPPINYFVLPNVIYTYPEAASSGLTEEEIVSMGREYKVGKASFRINPRAMASGMATGFVKVLSDKTTGKLLGMHLFCPQASELIQVGMVALSQQMTAEELGYLPFAHPTLSEAIKEACK
ncbi:MAG TPA: dihydrolipoyl dehydrogenase [Chlamydiales bacterium]|nr:dihydrolipoyl dehydrogenase [Chlamydiales bacterium]